jgi:hypothetical protein
VSEVKLGPAAASGDVDRSSPYFRREAAMAWTATLVSVFYYLWVGYVSYSRLPLVLKMQEGLGMKEGVNSFDAFLAGHSWVLLCGAVALCILLIVKEAVMADKRRSIVITCLVAVLCLVLLDVSRLLLMRPFASLIEQLS